jgi:L-seryl-tRNA(Ser) seleniumtransferase
MDPTHDPSSSPRETPQEPATAPGDLLRLIPQVERLLRWPELEEIIAEASRDEVAEAVRTALARLRGGIIEGCVRGSDLLTRLAPSIMAREVREVLSRRRLSAYRRAVNATGVILHTGLGRAVLAPSALEALVRSVSGYSVLELDVDTGERNHREGAVVEILRELTGAERGTVVNNNAAATMLILAGLAQGKEVIISRGQLVEIGGSFRIPDILAASGARLVEVGTTNRTYAEDYRRAIGPQTGLLLKVHTSNYEIQGFACHTPLEELVDLGRRHGIPVVSDLGSGCFVDLSPYGFRPEPLVRDSVRAGADVVCFSGDKLLGGPQSGIILGRADLIRAMRSHPLFRAVRVDKVTLALLEATLRLYRDPARLSSEVPVLRAIVEPPSSVRARATACADALRLRAPALRAEVVETRAQAGSGALPAQEIPSFGVAVDAPGTPPGELARLLRAADPPVFARIQDGRVVLDLRTVLEGETTWIVEALSAIAPA